MEHHSIVGLDIAKSVFQVHRTDLSGKVLERRTLRRGALLKYFTSLPPALIGIEACAGAHHWARSFQALGHDVRLFARFTAMGPFARISSAMHRTRIFERLPDFGHDSFPGGLTNQPWFGPVVAVAVIGVVVIGVQQWKKK